MHALSADPVSQSQDCLSLQQPHTVVPGKGYSREGEVLLMIVMSLQESDGDVDTLYCRTALYRLIMCTCVMAALKRETSQGNVRRAAYSELACFKKCNLFFLSY